MSTKTAQGRHSELESILSVTVNMTEAVIACDDTGQIVFMNPAARQLYGDPSAAKTPTAEYPGEYGVYDSSGRKLLDPDELPLAQASLGEVVRADLMIRNGQTFGMPVTATAFPLFDGTGRQIGAMVVCRVREADNASCSQDALSA